MTDHASSAVPPSATCAITAHGMCESRLSTIPALRDGAVPAGAPALPPRFLRHCDEHTVVGLRAVLEAIAATPSVANDLPQHGVIGAPCQAGRLVTARSLIQMRQDGPVAISTHIVPQCSLHSVAGAVSVALGLHGPHLGIGGGPDALAEGLFTVFSLFQAAACTACWLLVSDWQDEPALDTTGGPLGEPCCSCPRRPRATRRHGSCSPSRADWSRRGRSMRNNRSISRPSPARSASARPAQRSPRGACPARGRPRSGSSRGSTPPPSAAWRPRDRPA